jgi:hypothetical protein
MLLYHSSQHHPDQVKPYLDKMAAGADIADTAAETYEVVEDQDRAS